MIIIEDLPTSPLSPMSAPHGDDLTGLAAHPSNEIVLSESDSTRSGATADLPMTVWLRGDEPYFDEFTWDVDAVMHELQIRRSRLTQISGRELRVGKKRVDRYIRPVFRPTDVEEYKNWTRATASHLKSSQLLMDVGETIQQQVTTQLQQEVRTLQDTLSHGLTTLTNQLRTLNVDLHQGLAHASHASQTAITNQQHVLTQVQEQMTTRINAKLAHFDNGLQQMNQRIGGCEAGLANLMGDVREHIVEQRSRLQNIEETLAALSSVVIAIHSDTKLQPVALKRPAIKTRRVLTPIVPKLSPIETPAKPKKNNMKARKPGF